jgi:hypothetical protein
MTVIKVKNLCSTVKKSFFARAFRSYENLKTQTYNSISVSKVWHMKNLFFRLCSFFLSISKPNYVKLFLTTLYHMFVFKFSKPAETIWIHCIQNVFFFFRYWDLQKNQYSIFLSFISFQGVFNLLYWLGVLKIKWRLLT